MCKASRFVCIVSKFVWVSEGVEAAGNSPLIPRLVSIGSPQLLEMSRDSLNC
jgi:hypothetical protein